MTRNVVRIMAWILGSVTLLSASCGFADEGTDPSAGLRVMSYNIWRASDDSQNDWAIRKGGLVEEIRGIHPDLLGVQEAERAQMDHLIAQLPDYDFIGVGRDDGKDAGEFCAVFYKKARFEPLDSGTFWLSETPNVPGKRGWDAMCNRVVSWGKFRDKSSGRVLVYANTHFDHMGETARRESAKLIVNFQEQTAADLPFIVTGDFNSEETSEAYKTLTAQLIDARKAARVQTGGTRTFASDNVKYGENYVIDYVFLSDDFLVDQFHIQSEEPKDGVHPSDHFSVNATLEWK